MSQEIREKALAAAVQLGGDSAAIMQNAARFESYITGTLNARNPEVPAAKSAEKSASPKAPVKDVKPVVKPTAKPAPKKDEIDPDLKKMVGDKVNELLKADLRDEAVDLLASFEGATSATGIVKQGQEIVDAFMEQADALLTAAAEAGGMAD